jgi:hypothetical protein
MSPPRLLFCWFALGAARCLTSGGLTLIAVEEQARAEPAAPLVAGQPATLHILIPSGEAATDLQPRFVQLAGAMARPLELATSVLPGDVDSRVVRLRMTPPAVVRFTRLQLWLGPFGPLGVVVFPAGDPREDLSPLAAALEASRLRVLVAGAAPGLREFLRSRSLDFDDHGAGLPRQLSADTVLMGDFTPDDWERLTRDPATRGHLIAFMGEAALLPGIYLQSDPVARRHFAKITLPLTPLLATDPRARETLHTLLLQILLPAP